MSCTGQLTHFLFNLEAEENQKNWTDFNLSRCSYIGDSNLELYLGKYIKMNTTPENVPDETLLQAKVVRAQLLIKTNTRNIVREVQQIHSIDLEISTMQIGEFELMVQLDLEDCISGKSLATIGHF